jgi:hypothetical protein
MKNTSNAYQMFATVVHSRNHFYSFGIYRRSKRSVKQHSV